MDVERHNIKSNLLRIWRCGIWCRTVALKNVPLFTVSQGAWRNNEIATKVNMSTATLNNYLKTLIDLQIIEKVQPVGDENTKRSIYRIKDSMYAFWFAYVEPYISAIENFSGASAYETYVKPMLPQFMGPVFERMAYEYVGYRIQRGTIPFIPHSYGTWWGADNTTKQQVEIDILALGESKPSPNTSPQPLALLGECKWRNEPVKPVILEKLIEKGRCIYGAAYYWLFSKSGYTFTNTNPDIELITLENMYKI